MPERRGFWGRHWPVLVLLASLIPAVWYLVDFESDVDGEYPAVARPTFSAFPPAAYRVAEPGDTLDRMGLYAAAAAVVFATAGWLRARTGGSSSNGWLAALAVSLAALWHSMNPGPLPDGWHGMGWRTLLDAEAPTWLRLALGAAALILAGVALAARPDRFIRGLPSHTRGLAVAALALFVAGEVDLRLPGPRGYWPRWLYFLGVLSWALTLLRGLPPSGVGSRRGRRVGTLAAMGCWVLLIVAGRAMLWFERPIARLRAVVPGQVYISAMPDRRGLELAESRHHFKTIINLFPEDTHLRSPLLAQEEAFVRERGLTYLRNTTFDADPDRLLDDSLALVRDPKNWPVLVHCHACMDRTPAWAGIFEFVAGGRSLADVFQGIERHRGLRPKASVTLMYARQLPRLAPERFAADPSSSLLMRCAGPALAEYVKRTEPAQRAETSPASARR